MTVTNSSDITVAIVSASQARKSRSRLAALYAQECLVAHNVTVDLIHLKDYEILTYPHSKDDPTLKDLVQRFRAATAWVLAVPVYNWGPSGVLTNFLHYALSDDPQRRFRPFVILGGAGGQKSFMALDSLAQTMVYEISAVQVGPVVLAAGDQADRDTGVLHSDVKRRIERSMEALCYYAAAATALSNRQPYSIVSPATDGKV